MQKIRIVYVPTNQSAASLVKQGSVQPFYQKPFGTVPFIGNDQKHKSPLRPQSFVGNQPKQFHPPKANPKVNIQQPMAAASMQKPKSRKNSRPIDAGRIFNAFPQLRESGVTEEILRDLNDRVPNLEQRIQAHFNLHRAKPALYANSVHHDLAASNLAFMKNFHEALESQKSQKVANLFGNDRNVQSQANFGLAGNQLVPKQAQKVADINNRLQSLALQNFQSKNFMDSTNMQTREGNVQNGDRTMNYKTPAELSIQRFRSEQVPEAAYMNGNFDKQTNRPGLVFLPGDQLTSYGYNSTNSRGILPQPISQDWQSNRLASYYNAPQYRNSWTSFTTCSSTCGRGMKKRFRKCEIPDCPSGGVEIETAPCINMPCAGNIYITTVYFSAILISSEECFSIRIS